MTNLEMRPSVGLSAEATGRIKGEAQRIRAKAINKFANMGLSGREISCAVEIETGIKVSPHDVVNLVNAARQRGTVRKLTEDEKRDIARTTSNSWDFTDEVILKDVESILRHIKSLEESRKPLPANRLEVAIFRPSQKIQPSSPKGGIKDGHKIIFSDGRHVPTYKGIKHSPEIKARIIRSNLGRLRPERAVRKESTVYELIGPLCIRVPELSAVECSQITEFTKNPLSNIQIKMAMERKGRPAWHSLPLEFGLKENARKRHKRGLRAAFDKIKLGKNSFLPEEYTDLISDIYYKKFIARFLENGFFGWDLSAWKKLENLFIDNKKQIINPLIRLRLEVYMCAVEKAKSGEVELLNQYRQLGKSISPAWFDLLASEEGFIAAKLLTDWADGEDEKGFFELNAKGEKTRHMVFIDEVWGNDSSTLALKKLKTINGRNGIGSKIDLKN